MTPPDIDRDAVVAAPKQFLRAETHREHRLGRRWQATGAVVGERRVALRPDHDANSPAHVLREPTVMGRVCARRADVVAGRKHLSHPRCPR